MRKIKITLAKLKAFNNTYNFLHISQTKQLQYFENDIKFNCAI